MKNVSPRWILLQSVAVSLIAASAAAQAPAVESRPCKDAPEFRGMDFWVGDWEVETAQGIDLYPSAAQIEALGIGHLVMHSCQGAAH